MAKGYNIVGISGQKTRVMRDAVRAYVKKLTDNLELVKDNVSTDSSFRGEYGAAVSEYVLSVKNLCIAYTSELLKFSDILDMISDEYHKRDIALSDEVKAASNDLKSKSEDTFYTEKREDKDYETSSSTNTTASSNYADAQREKFAANGF